MKWGFLFLFFFASFSIFALEDEVPTDVSASEDFQYIVKVIGIQNNPEALEKLSLNWGNFKKLFNKARGSISKFENIRRKAPMHVYRRSEFSFFTFLGIIRNYFLEIGIGCEQRGLCSSPYIKLGFRLPWGAGVAAGFKFRKTIENKKYPEMGLESESAIHRGGFLGIGGYEVTAPIFHEKAFGVGAGILTTDDINIYGINIPIFWAWRNGLGIRVRVLEAQVADLIEDFQNFKINDLREKLEIFEDHLAALEAELGDRIPFNTLLAPLSDLHPLASIQNLFEPTLYELNHPVKKSLTCAKEVKMLGPLEIR